MSIFPKPKKLFTKKKISADEAMQIFSKNSRRKGVVWTEVDPDELRACIWAVVASGHMIGFAEATGGVGVKLQVWINRDKHYSVAIEADELNEFLVQYHDLFCSPSESIRVQFGKEDTRSEESDGG